MVSCFHADAAGPRRLWVIQEVVLASSSTCYWGKFQVDIVEVLRAARWLRRKYRFIPKTIYLSPSWMCAIELFDILDNVHGKESRQRDIGFLLELAQRFEKTEPRDSVYATLGMMSTAAPRSTIPADPKLLKVDYTKSLPEVLRDATRYALCHDGWLTILRTTHLDSHGDIDKEGFPTWVVRADGQRKMRGIGMLPVFYTACIGLDLPSLLADTSHGLDVLLTEGFVADCVVETTVACEEHWTSYQGIQTWLSLVKRLVLKRDVYGSQDLESLRYTVMACTLTAGQTTKGERAQTKDLVVLASYLENLQAADESTSNEPNVRTSWDRDRMNEVFAASPIGFFDRRKFFVTSEGRMGLGPRLMREDDLVVILRGGLEPIILRKVDNHYRLIGVAYIYGIMDGEAANITKAKNIPEVVFPIH
jgi:hypothetical protein